MDRCHLEEFSADQSKLLVSSFYSRPGLNIPQIADIGEHYLSYVFDLEGKAEEPNYAEIT